MSVGVGGSNIWCWVQICIKPQIPYVQWGWGGMGGFQLLMLSPNLHKTQISYVWQGWGVVDPTCQTDLVIFISSDRKPLLYTCTQAPLYKTVAQLIK